MSIWTVNYIEDLKIVKIIIFFVHWFQEDVITILMEKDVFPINQIMEKNECQ